MAGLNLSGAGGGRRALDAEINAVPMVDLMMVTISFLLITAVWSHMQRMDATTRAPGDPTTVVEREEPHKTFEVEARPDRFVLTWRRGTEVLESTDVAFDTKKEGGGLRFPTLAAQVGEAYRRQGEHRDPSDRTFDRAVLKVHDRLPYGEIVGVMDAVSAAHRSVTRNGKQESVPAFDLVMSR